MLPQVVQSQVRRTEISFLEVFLKSFSKNIEEYAEKHLYWNLFKVLRGSVQGTSGMWFLTLNLTQF